MRLSADQLDFDPDGTRYELPRAISRQGSHPELLASARHARSPNESPARLVAGNINPAMKASSSSSATRRNGMGRASGGCRPRLNRYGRNGRQPRRDWPRSSRSLWGQPEPSHHPARRGGGL